MKQINNITWKADEGKTFRRLSDNMIMGPRIQLGKNGLTKERDSIDNYDEVIEQDNYRNKTNNDKIIRLKNYEHIIR